MDKTPSKGSAPDIGGDKKLAGGGKGTEPVGKAVDKAKQGLAKPAGGDMKKPGEKK